MMYFFQNKLKNIVVVQATDALTNDDISKFEWLFGEAKLLETTEITGWFVGPRRDLISPWSDNTMFIAEGMNIHGIVRIEHFTPTAPPKKNASRVYDPMLQGLYENLNDDIFANVRQPEPIQYVDDIAAYNQKEEIGRAHV